MGRAAASSPAVVKRGDPEFWNRPLEAPWREVPLLLDAQGREWEAQAQARNPARVRARLEQAVDHWTAISSGIPHLSTLGPPMPRPHVIFDLEGLIAGMAVTAREPKRLPRQWVRINTELLGRYPVRMIQQTVPHEMAHLVVDWYLPRASIDPHGPEWMAVMIWFGRPPQTHHDMRSARTVRRGARQVPLFEAPHPPSGGDRR